MEFNMTEKGFSAELPFGRMDISGNDEDGFRPYQLMVSSIAVCSGIGLRRILAKKRYMIHDIKITAEADRAEGLINKIEAIRIHFIIKGENLDEAQVKKAVSLASKNCPMVQSVNGSINITETFELAD